MSSSNKQTFSVGSLADSSNVIYLQNKSGKKAVVDFLRLVRKTDVEGLTINMTITINGTSVRYIPMNLAVNQAYMMDLIDDKPVVLRAGDYISMSCSVTSSIDFIVSGELHEDL